MTFSLSEKFVQDCRRATPDDQLAVFRVLDELRSALHDPQRRAGMGLRKLNPTSLWEVRIGLHLRAVFLQQGGVAVFMLLGTHSEVHRFLRTYKD